MIEKEESGLPVVVIIISSVGVATHGLASARHLHHLTRVGERVAVLVLRLTMTVTVPVDGTGIKYYYCYSLFVSGANSSLVQQPSFYNVLSIQHMVHYPL
jgi:hypothetical protein